MRSRQRSERETRIASELERLEPTLARMEERLVDGALMRDVLAEVGVEWLDVSKYGRVVTGRIRQAQDWGTLRRHLLREERLHFKAMAGDERAAIRLLERDQLRAPAHCAHTR